MNLAKLFKLPKKLGDSLLISLINNMVDYLRNYDSTIKVDDDGYIHLASANLYLEGNGDDVDICSNLGINLNTNNEGSINLYSDGAITINSDNEESINLNSSGGINLYTNNEYDISLNSDNDISLNSNYDIDLNANDDININASGDIDLSSDNGNNIHLYVHGGDYNRELNIWSDEDGLQYTQDGDVLFKINEGGNVYIRDFKGNTQSINSYILGNSGKNIVIENNLNVNVIVRFYNNINNDSFMINANSSDRLEDFYYNSNNSFIPLQIEFDEGNISTSDQIIIYLWNDNNVINSYYYPIDSNGGYTTKQLLIDFGNITKIKISSGNYCYTADTLITLADGSTKQVKDITYDDELKVWNFDEGKDDVAKPLWIKRTEYAKSYQLVTLSDGNTIKLCGSDGKYHCMFDVTEQKFNHAVDCIGHEVYTENGIVTVVSIEEVKEKVDHYNIVTNYHMNLYANHILTSTEKNNIYPIADMKFVKDDRKIVPYEEFEKAHISREYYDGWRAGEWNEPLKDVITHLRRRKIYTKPQKRVKDGLRTDYFG